ncbi:MAG: sugar phosphate isomerase/epimerase [Candidatus Omnitrophica bacterium]|nr:sugar phosphate isomerase/epimerase [Candidatus Omnitrophota bacterium]
MKIPFEKLYISCVDERLIEKLFTEPLTFNLEIALFSLPDVLDTACDKYTSDLLGVFRKYPVKRTIHGPFRDLHYHSSDKRIVEVVRYRFLQAIEVARRLGASHIVYHSTFTPFIVNREFPKLWLERSLGFWPKIVECAARSNITLLIENIWDDKPEHMRDLIRGVNSPYFKACLDMGHINIFSKVPLANWLDVLGKDLVYFHIHNNPGAWDLHRSLGKGSINYEEIFREIEGRGLDPIFTIEVMNRADVEESLAYLRERGYVDF